MVVKLPQQAPPYPEIEVVVVNDFLPEELAIRWRDQMAALWASGNHRLARPNFLPVFAQSSLRCTPVVVAVTLMMILQCWWCCADGGWWCAPTAGQWS